MRFALLLLLSGCTHLVWRQDGATQQQLTTDIYECDRDARAAGEERDLRDGAQEGGPVFQACMVERRWRLHGADGFRGRGWRQAALE
jgi:hypothetical protein